MIFKLRNRTEIAINKRKPKEPIIFHSDHGCHFKSASFRKLLDEHQLLASYSKPGYPYDNAVTEVFFKYLKQREINRRTYHSIQEVQLSCFEYIEQFYNNYNPHSANNGLTPNQKEKNYFKKWKVNEKLDTELREFKNYIFQSLLETCNQDLNASFLYCNRSQCI